jgi:hypothetical protein
MVLDRKQGIVRRQSPEVTAAERELYTLEDDCGERDRRVESGLADHVDGPGQHVIRVLDEGGRLGGEDAGKLAIFVAALYVRTPAFREQQRQLAEQMRDSLIRAGVEPAVVPLPESHPEPSDSAPLVVFAPTSSWHRLTRCATNDARTTTTREDDGQFGSNAGRSHPRTPGSSHPRPRARRSSPVTRR